MKPPFKYSGGKSREIKNILPLMPKEWNRIIEPFAGGAALSFYLEKPAILCDIRENNIKTFEAVRDNFDSVYEYIQELKTKDTEYLEKEYYRQRDTMFGCKNSVDIAKRWITLRQLCFSGMDRINSKTGKFNVPFAWYNKFSCNLSNEHSLFLKKCELILGDWSIAYNSAKPDDFVFLDPPYLSRNSEYGGEYKDSEDFHIKISEKFKDVKTKSMIVHIDCDLYRDLYKDFNIIDKNFMYSQNFKGRTNSNQKVNHLYITNY
jgi:DNA adenine methylase